MNSKFVGNVLLVGYGAIGQALTSPLINHFALDTKKIRVIAADAEGQSVAESFNIDHQILPLTPDNYKAILEQYLVTGDLLINISVHVSSLELIKWCQRHEVFYLDTCVEPWAGGYEAETMAETTNYALRHHALKSHANGTVSSVIAHGANPGLVSHFVKKGLEELAKDSGIKSWDSYAELSEQLGIKVIQIAERDTQSSDIERAAAEFHNTWSVKGLMAEARQPAEMGWGSHEETLPIEAIQHGYGDLSGIYLAQESMCTQVKSWVPSFGEQEAYLITHHEALSIANFLTVHDEEEKPLYRPTVYFAYHPADVARKSLEEWRDNKYIQPVNTKIIRDEVIAGHDEMGVLFIFEGGAYWYGSTLKIEEARVLAPFNNATTMQVVAGILGALEWMFLNPRASVVEPESLDHEMVLRIALPYLGEVRGVYSDWQPATQSGLQFSDFSITE
jgi:homospermidine synthase